MRYKLDGDKVSEPEKVISLKLKRDSIGDVDLVGVDEEGVEYLILSITEGGFLQRWRSAKKLGLETDEDGKIKVNM